MSGGNSSGAGAVARALLEAVFSNDVDGAVRLCSPDLVLTLESSHTVEGHEGLRQLMEFNAEISTEVRIEIHHVLADGDTVAINRTTYLTIDGQPLSVDVGAFFVLRDGLVDRWTDYQDLREISRALGH
jgi:ketosteroid isomerase-like protein